MIFYNFILKIKMGGELRNDAADRMAYDNTTNRMADVIKEEVL